MKTFRVVYKTGIQTGYSKRVLAEGRMEAYEHVSNVLKSSKLEISAEVYQGSKLIRVINKSTKL